MHSQLVSNINFNIDFLDLLIVWVGVFTIKGSALKQKACRQGEIIGKKCLLFCIIFMPFLITKIAVTKLGY